MWGKWGDCVFSVEMESIVMGKDGKMDNKVPFSKQFGKGMDMKQCGTKQHKK